MKVSFLDLRISDVEEKRELLLAVESVFDHGRIVLGPEVQELEEKIASFCGRKYAISVNSGTDALWMGLKSLGIGSGDEVITTALSWVATANAISLTGAVPVFADIGDDLNMDPRSVTKLVTPRTKAIMPVHYTGKVCKMSELAKLAQEFDLPIIEDASQAFSAAYHGRMAGSFGKIACFSMNPMKIFAACGEAGMVLTDDPVLRDRLVSLRYNGTVNREECICPSLNGRLDTLQAAILLRRLPRVEQIVNKRREIASWYKELLSGIVDTPQESGGEFDVYYTYTIRAPRRDDLRQYLESRGIETKIQHPLLMPQQPAYLDMARGEYQNAERLLKRILCIPAHEKLSKDEVVYVASCIRDFYKDGQDARCLP